ncbi:hypothetical protein MalM25_11620 [Planctomycetes bacterium MalM25]|nr:hypothetical protein MalM25_11620 [Planctomycetes bacterium MalM25]
MPATSPATDTLAAAIDRLAAAPVGGYHPDGEAASEPIANAAIALSRAGRDKEAELAAEWLVDRQTRAGSVGVTASEDDPAWPTALAMLAWQGVDAERYAERIARAAAWALGQEPTTIPRDPIFGHDTTIEGWSWAPATHSWLEPTAFYSVALRACGHASHPRRGEAVRLLVDRLMPSGGANYGNTTVFGQELLQHVHSSGVAAWALAGEEIEHPRLDATLDYLRRAIEEPTGVASLAWAVRGLATHGRIDEPLRRDFDRAWARVEKSASLHKTALYALAGQELRA